MSDSDRRYSDDEVSTIIRRALSRGGPKDTISHEELEEIARSSGVTSGELQAAIDAQESEAEVEALRAQWIARHRKEFSNHLTSYCIINGFLLLVNLMTMPRLLWVVWPMMGWGIGLAFHFRDTYYPSEDQSWFGISAGVAAGWENLRDFDAWIERAYGLTAGPRFRTGSGPGIHAVLGADFQVSTYNRTTGPRDSGTSRAAATATQFPTYGFTLSVAVGYIL